MTEGPPPPNEPIDIPASRETIDALKQSLDRGGEAAENARNRALHKVVKLKQQAAQEKNTTQSDAREDKLITFVNEISKDDQPGIERRIIEHDIKKNQAEEYERVTHESIETMPQEDAGGYFQALAQSYHAESQRYPPDSREANEKVSVRDFLAELAVFIRAGAVDRLDARHRQLLEMRSSFNANDFSRVRIKLEGKIVQLLKQKHTRNGRVRERELAQDLYNRAKLFEIDVDFGSDSIQREYNEGYANWASGLHGRIRAEQVEEEQKKQREEYFSIFQLSESDREIIFSEDPLRFVEDLIRQYEGITLAHKSQIASALTQRFSLLIQYITSPEFIEQWEKKSEIFRQDQNKFTVEWFKKTAQSMWRDRTSMHNFRGVIDEADFKAIMQVAGDAGSGSWFQSLLSNKAYVAFHRLEQKIEQIRLTDDEYDPTHTQKVRITSDEIRELTNGTIAELQAQKELYGFSSDSDVKAAVNTAMNLFITSQRIAHHIAKGRAPLEEYRGLGKGRHSYLTDPYDFVASTFNVLDFHVDKWSTMTTNQQTVLGNMLKLIGGDDIELGRQRFSDMLQVYDVFSSGWRIRETLRVLEQVIRAEHGDEGKEIYDSIALGLKLKQAAKGHRWGDIGGASEEKKVKNREDLVIAWENIARYRPQEILKVFADHVRYKLVKNEMGTNWEYKIENGHKALDSRYSNIAAEALASLDLHGEDKDGNQIQIRNFAQLQRYVGKYFNPINEMLANYTGDVMDAHGRTRQARGLAAINYSEGQNGLSTKQRAIVDRVFEKIGGEHWEDSRNNYFEIMGKLTQFGSDQSGVRVRGAKFVNRDGTLRVIDELVDNPLYETIYTRIQFMDDARYWMAEDTPEGITPISQQFSLNQGRGMKDMLPRAWGDMSMASQALQNLQNGMTTLDKEELLKQAKEMWDNIKAVEGVSEGTAATMYLVGGWLQSAKTDSFLAWTGLDKLPGMRSSEFQRKLGLGGPSMNPVDRHEITEWLGTIAGNLEDLTHDEDLVKRYEDITKSSETTMNIFRARTLILIILFFIMQQMFKEAQETEK